MNIETNILKSPNDKRLYKSIILPNKLQALLIQDDDAEKSAAALDVHIGQLEDPEENQGLAHFLEHMLFMGTKKYPIQNEYSDFIGKHSGSDNAFTDLTDTNYYFDIANDHFEKALDMFAQFFISPLFDETCVDKEIKAVDSEHQMGLTNDDCRNWQLFKETAKKSSFKQNGGGSLQTLQKPSIREDLLKFYEKYYSANLMKLVITSNASIETQEKWVTEKFSDVPNKDIVRPRYTEVPYDQSNLSKFIKLVPIKDEDTLEILWIIPTQRNAYREKSCNMITHLLGQEGKNSLTTFLIDEGLILELYSYSENILDFFTVLGVKVTLTEEGLENYEQVCGYIYKFLDVLKTKGVQQWQYEEMQQIEDIAFRFKEKSDASDYVSMLAQRLQFVPVEDCLKYSYIFQGFNKQKIDEILTFMTIENMQIYLSSPEFEEDEDFVAFGTEKHYGTRFLVDNLSEDLVESCLNPQKLQPQHTNKNLDLTIKNEFIPKNFDLVPNNNNIKPEKIHQSDLGHSWFMKDNKFEVSKGWMTFIVYSNDINMHFSVEGWVKAELWLLLFEFYVQELIDMGDQTYLKCTIEYIPGGLKYKFKGYDNTILEFIQEIFKKVWEFDVERDGGERIFNVIYEKYLNELQNFFKESPEKIALYYSRDIYQVESRFPQELKLEALENLKYPEFRDSIKNEFFKKIYIEQFFYGNFQKEVVLKCIQKQEELYKQYVPDYKIQKKEEIKQIRVAKMNPQQTIHYEYSLDQEDNGNQEEPNSAIQIYFQGELDTFEYRLKMKILKNYLSEPFFDQLRTNEQLGYSVCVYDEYVRGIAAMIFQIQSSVADPNQLTIRIQSFLDDYREKIKKMTDEEFENVRNSVLVKLTEKEDNMFKEALNFYKEIYYHTYMFDRKEKVKEFIGSIKKQDIIDLYETLIFVESKRVEAHIISKEHTESQKESFKKRKDQERIQKIEDITEFQKQKIEAGELFEDNNLIHLIKL